METIESTSNDVAGVIRAAFILFSMVTEPQRKETARAREN